ncbi:MAG: right-handed parallel beta-helix repeat-containing protein [Armatimonadia bacterium]
MHLRRSLIAVIILIGVVSMSHAAVTMYVSPTGNDEYNGKAAVRKGPNGPFKTLVRARDEIRKMKQAGVLPVGGVTVELQPGVYEFSTAFELTEADSGTPTAPVVYRGKPGAEVRMVGGKVVSKWEPVTDPSVIRSLAQEAVGKVMQADLKALGITEFGQPSGGWVSPSGNNTELFFADKPMQIARWPNQGFVRVADVTDEKPVDVRGTKGSKAPKIHYDEKALGDRPKRWQQEKALWLHGWWFWDWAEERQPVESIDLEKKLITMKEPPVHPYGFRKGQWWYAFNALCELDQPGEYYLDRETGILYFWPPSPLNKSLASVSVTPTLVTMKNTSNVTWRGLSFETARNIPITISGGSENRVAGCVVRNCGGYAISIDGGTKNGVVGCDIYETGNGGVMLNGGDRIKLIHSENYVDNCHIHHYSRWNRILKPAVNMNGCGNRITHNLIDNAPHKAILFSGNENLIEFNEMHSVVYEANDAGAIYAGYNWTMRGNEIRNNYFHHIEGFEGRGCVGVYLDDLFSSANIHHNVFYKVTRAAFVGGGRDTTIENNVFVDCNPAIHVDARGLGWASGAYDTLVKRLKEVPYETEPWRSKWPQLLTILEDEPMTPKGNVVARNINVRGRWDEIEAKARPHVTFIDNLLDKDPEFVKPAPADSPDYVPLAKDFALKANSPALALGFKPIPVEQIGVYKSELRASWPVTSVVRPLTKPTAATVVPRGPMPTLTVKKAAGPIVIDGKITEAEWGGAAAMMPLAQGLDGSKLKTPSQAWLAHDGTNLYIAVQTPIPAGKALKTQDVWGGNDAVEVAVRNVPADPKSAILVLRGYPNGVFHSDDEAGAPAAAVKKAAEGVVYKVTVAPEKWVTEWKIPLASLGIDPATSAKFAFNLTVHSLVGEGWVMWQGTRDKATWQADVAGWLELGK